VTSDRRAHLAQANLSRMRFPVAAEPMAEFAAALERINALAEHAPGFIWRYRSNAGEHISLLDATGDPLMIINLSVWHNYELLHDFTYRTAHMHYLRRRAEWFTRIEMPTTVLWWIESGHQPAPDEALRRLQHLRRYGPAPPAFTVRRRFDPTGRAEIRSPRHAEQRRFDSGAGRPV
jgi:hypothetical protein